MGFVAGCHDDCDVSGEGESVKLFIVCVLFLVCCVAFVYCFDSVIDQMSHTNIGHQIHDELSPEK